MFNSETMRINAGTRISPQEASLKCQRQRDQIQADFVVNLLPNLQNYYRRYLGVDLFEESPYLFSKLPLTNREFSYFIAVLSQSTTSHRHIVNMHNLHMIDRAFEGRSTYATRRVTFPTLIRLSQVLKVPIEAILYGTLDTRAIAHYNYVNYDRLPSALHLYLSRRIKHADNFPFLLTQEHLNDYTDRALGDILGISRTAANSLKKRPTEQKRKSSAGIPLNQRQLERYATAFGVSPEFIIEVPVVLSRDGSGLK